MVTIGRGEFLKGILSASALGLSGCLSFSHEDERLSHTVDFLRSGIIGRIVRVNVWNSRSGVMEDTLMRLLPTTFLAADFGPLLESECVIAYNTSDDHAPESSIVKIKYTHLEISWFDGDERPLGETENTGCRIIGTEGDLFIPDEKQEVPLIKEPLADLADGIRLAVIAQKNPGRVIKIIP